MCEVCATPVVQVCPRRDCPVTTCPAAPSCKKVCLETTTVMPSPPRSSSPPPSPGHSLEIVLGVAAASAAVAILATLAVVWFISRHSTKVLVEESTNDDEPPGNIECHPLVGVESPNTTVVQVKLLSSM